MAPLLPWPLFASVTSELRSFPVGPQSYLAYVHGLTRATDGEDGRSGDDGDGDGGGVMSTTGGCCGSEQRACGVLWRCMEASRASSTR